MKGAGLLSPPRPRTTMVLDVPVVEGPIPEPWSAAITTAVGCADSNRALYRTPDFSAYTEDGRFCAFQTASPARRSEFDYVIYSWAQRWLMLQRGQFCLRAAVVRSPEGTVIALIGRSGSGKSTTAAHLCSQGWTFLGDDIAQVSLGGAGVTVTTFDRPIHLSARTIESLGFDPQIGRHLPHTDRRAVTLRADPGTSPLHQIFELSVRQAPSEPVEVGPLAAIKLISELSWPEHAELLPDLVPQLLRWSSDIAARVPLIRIARPAACDSVDLLTDLVSQTTARFDKLGQKEQPK